jgi:hypothetical protein
MAGGLRVEGGQQLRALAAELKAADRALWLATARNLRAIAKPAVRAVQEEERRVLPKRGGLNEWVASTPVGVRITTGTRSAGVRLVQSKKGRAKPHDLLDANETGLIRHPTRMGPRFSQENRTGSRSWQDTPIPTGWWERPLLAMAPEAMTAMKQAMDEAARVAGFRGP